MHLIDHIITGNKKHSADSFFAGIPILKGYNKWIEYINGEPGLGIDSIGKRGLYSSIKINKKSHFPFPDSVEVKSLLYTAINLDSSGRFSPDTLYRIITKANLLEKILLKFPKPASSSQQITIFHL